MTSMFRGLFLIVAGTLLVPVQVRAEPIKLAAVEMAKIFNEHPKTKKTKAEFDEKKIICEKELTGRMDDIKKIEDDGKKIEADIANPALTGAKRDEKLKALEEKKNEYRNAIQRLNELKVTRERELKEQSDVARAAILGEIAKVIQDKAKKEGYTMVIDKSGLTMSGLSPFIFVQDSLDITNEIIKLVTAGSSTASSTPAAATSAAKDDKTIKK